MKRIASIGLTVALLLSTSACTGGHSNVPATSPNTIETTCASTEVLITASMTKPTAITTESTTVPATVTTKTPTIATKAPATVTTKATTVPTTVTTKAPTIATKAPTTVTTEATTAATKCSHSSAEWVIDKAATCVEKGEKHKLCNDCKTVIESAVIDETEHSYSNYKCTVCGVFQENGINGYLTEWVQNNGKAHGETISLDFYIDDILYGFTYNASGNYFYFSLLDENYNDFLSMKFTDTAGIYDLAYIQGTEPNTREIYGTIDASKFTVNTPITVEEYLGASDARSGAAENCRICTGLLLEAIATALDEYKVGLTLNDLGFSEFK